jgi:hypothetical protein
MARETLGPDAGAAGRLLDRSRQELDEALKGDTRAGAWDPPDGAVRARPRGGRRGTRSPRPAASRGGRAARARAPRAGCAGRLLVVSEALTNVAKHASATHATVTVTNGNGRLAVTVSDDGVGGADIALGTGLRGLSDRLTAINGRFDIDSKPGHGTTLRASIPCP